MNSTDEMVSNQKPLDIPIFDYDQNEDMSAVTLEPGEYVQRAGSREYLSSSMHIKESVRSHPPGDASDTEDYEEPTHYRLQYFPPSFSPIEIFQGSQPPPSRGTLTSMRQISLVTTILNAEIEDQNDTRGSMSSAQSEVSTITDFSVQENQRDPSRTKYDPLAARKLDGSRGMPDDMEGMGINGQHFGYVCGPNDGATAGRDRINRNRFMLNQHKPNEMATGEPSEDMISYEKQSAIRVNSLQEEQDSMDNSDYNEHFEPQARNHGSDTMNISEPKVLSGGWYQHSPSGSGKNTWGAGMRRAQAARRERVSRFAPGELDPFNMFPW